MTPKFKIGDKVTMRSPSLYNETTGEIVEVERVFKRVNRNGNFEPDGLETLERTIKNIAIPYEFDSNKLTVHYPEYDYGDWVQKARTETSLFYSYAYTVKTASMLCIYPQHSLTITEQIVNSKK